MDDLRLGGSLWGFWGWTERDKIWRETRGKGEGEVDWWCARGVKRGGLVVR